MSQTGVSSQTRNNWLLDAALFLSAALASLSGSYFLFFPSGGYQGGRNPAYGVRVIWDVLHTWSGAVMIFVALVHLALHWNWMTAMLRRLYREWSGQCACMNRRGHLNVLLNFVVALAFVASAVSGVYFLFAAGHGGGRNVNETVFLLSRTGWDMLHTWSSVIWIGAALLHAAIHWRWLVNVGRRLLSQPVRIAGRARVA